MPYFSKTMRQPHDNVSPEMVVVKHPLVPESQKPEACRRLGCALELFCEGVMKDEHGEITFDLRRQSTVAWGHTLDGRTETYLIPMARLEDASDDIWPDVKSWMESLHT